MLAFYRKQRNFLAIALLICLSPILYRRLNKAGYAPPVNYFFSQAENSSTLQLTPPAARLFNYNKSIKEIIPEAIDKSQTAILIDKSNYELTLFYQNQPIKSYPIVLGKSPEGDKRREGDLKTPEGIFKIRHLYPHPSWSKFIWIDYPTQESWRKHLQNKLQGKISPFSRVGSEIGIHGVPTGRNNLIDEQNNWTWGCIALKNEDVNELYGVVTRGIIIKIIP